MTPLKMAVVGVGALGQHHARILAGLDTVNLVAVADTDAQQAAEIAGRHGTTAVVDFETLLDKDLDAVSIAVPTQYHLPVASGFLKQRIPVLVEKPLARSSEEAAQLVSLAEQHETILQVGHIERFNPATSAAWQVAGKPKYIRAERVSPFTFRSTDIGVVHDLMIHDLDLILDLVRSEIVDVDAFGVAVMGDHEDCVQARLRFANGCVADVTASRLSPTAKRTMQLWSADGCVTVDFQSRAVTRFAPSEMLLYGTSPVSRALSPEADIARLRADVFGKFLTVENWDGSDADALTAELTSFVECVRTGSQPLVDGPAAQKALDAAAQILSSVESHCWDPQLGIHGARPSRIEPHRRAG